MATVPVYDLPTQDPSVGNMPAFQAPTVEPMRDFTGEQLQKTGQAVQSFGTTVMKIADRLQGELDDAKSKELYNTFAAQADTIETKYLTLKGKEAVGATMKTRNDLDAALTDVLGKTENDVQKMLLKNAASVRMRSANSSIIKHSLVEQRDYDVKETGAKVDTMVNDAVRYSAGFRNPQGDFAIYYGAAKKEANVLADKLGYEADSAQRQQLILKATNSIHGQAVQAAIDGQNLDDARDYLQRYGNEMTPETYQRAKKALEIGTSDAKEQGIADKIWADSGNNIAAALEKARTTLSGKEEDAVVQRLKIFDTEKNTIIQRAQGEAKDKAWRVYSETGDFKKVPATVLAGMDGADLASLQRTAKADLEARTKGVEVKTDSNVYYQLTQEAIRNPDFKDPTKFDLRRYFDKLSPGDRNHFINLQRTIGTKNEAPEAVTTQQQISATIKQLGLKDEKAGMFTSQANQALFAAQVQNGGKLDQNQRQKIIDGLVIQGEVLTGSWFRPDPNMYRFEARARGEEGKFKPEFTDAQRARAREAIINNTRNKNPTKKDVEDLLYDTYGIQQK
jgi:biotin operon repressor